MNSIDLKNDKAGNDAAIKAENFLADIIIRFVLGGLALLPFVWTLGNLLSSYQIHWLSFMPPLDLMKFIDDLSSNTLIVALVIHMIAAIIFWHAVFLPLILGRSKSRLLRTLSRSTDYLWYAVGALVVVLLFSDFQHKAASETIRILKDEADSLRESWMPALEDTKRACDSIVKNGEETRDGVAWAKQVCERHITDDDLDIYGIEDTCMLNAMAYTYEPSNYARFTRINGEGQHVADVLNQIHYYCFLHVHHELLTKRARGIDDARQKFANLPTFDGQFPDPKLTMFYMVLFAFALGAKLSKTSVDVFTEFRKRGT